MVHLFGISVNDSFLAWIFVAESSRQASFDYRGA
jgi:hypothetical protein